MYSEMFFWNKWQMKLKGNFLTGIHLKNDHWNGG